MSIEANLTSHLSISYSAVPTASGAPAAASGQAAPQDAKVPSGEGMAGFLAALVDQLLAGASAGTNTTATADTGGTEAGATPAPFGTAIDPAALAVVQSAVPRGNILLKQLTQGLQALQDQLDNGETPDPELLKRLGDLADAIAAMINVPAPAATPTIDPSTALDPLAAIGRTTGKTKTDPLAGLADTTPASQPPAGSDQVSQFLAGLGLQVPASTDLSTAAPINSSADQSVGAVTPAKPLPAIAQLADKLAALTQTIAAASPDVAQKLDALARKFNTAETAPQALAQLTAASDSDGAELDRVVQALLAARPAGPSTSAPPLAAKTELSPPAPIVSTAPPADTIQPFAAPPSSNAPATAIAKPATTAKLADVPPADDAPKAGAKLIAAATAGSESKSADSADTSAQANAASTPATAAPTAPPRVIPAAYQVSSSPINMGQVAFEMVRQVHQGTSRFSFRLDPPELGRVDVKLHVDASGTVSARLTVERSETLDMFQRDRGALEKALTQAGLDSGKTNLEFSLKQNQQNPFAGLSGGDQRPAGGNAGTQLSLAGSADDGQDGASAIPSITLYRGVASAGGVNLFV